MAQNAGEILVSGDVPPAPLYPHGARGGVAKAKAAPAPAVVVAKAKPAAAKGKAKGKGKGKAKGKAKAKGGHWWLRSLLCVSTT